MQIQLIRSFLFHIHILTKKSSCWTESVPNLQLLGPKNPLSNNNFFGIFFLLVLIPKIQTNFLDSIKQMPQ
jgi:hypothetical protein